MSACTATPAAHYDQSWRKSLAMAVVDSEQDVGYAAVLHGKNDLRFETGPSLGSLKAGMVRVAVKAMSICGSDVHLIAKGKIGIWELSEPMVIGHESAGVVVQIGDGVQNVRVGDRVALEPGSPCWLSNAARMGRYNLATDVECFGCPTHCDGALRNVMDHHAEFCFKLPEDVSFHEGAMCEPLSVGIHACRKGGVQPGRSVLILGSGPIGLMTLVSAKAFGATKVIMTDVNAHNLALAKKMGATQTYCHAKTAKPTDIADKLKQMFGPKLPEIVFDCVGMESTVRTAVLAASPGSKIVIVGLAQDDVSVPLSLLAVYELEILGSLRYTNTYPLCLSLLEDKIIDIMPMVSHCLGFSEEEVAKGFDLARCAAEHNAVKVMFNL